MQGFKDYKPSNNKDIFVLIIINVYFFFYYYSMFEVTKLYKTAQVIKLQQIYNIKGKKRKGFKDYKPSNNKDIFVLIIINPYFIFFLFFNI